MQTSDPVQIGGDTPGKRMFGTSPEDRSGWNKIIGGIAKPESAWQCAFLGCQCVVCRPVQQMSSTPHKGWAELRVTERFVRKGQLFWGA